MEKRVCKAIVAVVVVIFLSISTLSSQSFLNIIQLNGGLVSNSISDTYLGKLDYLPQFRISNDKFRFGGNVGTFYNSKSLSASFGLNGTFRLKRISTLNNNFGLGGIFLRVGHEWGTDSQKVLMSSLSFEFTQISVNISYGRDLQFDNNWISYGFAFLFSKREEDENE